jgi:hypothetical protein
MRKISILNEDFIALEQKIAEALDSAENHLDTVENEISETLGQVFQQVGEGSFKEDPAFIEFKNSDGRMIEKLPEVIRENIVKSVRGIKSVKMVDLMESALISKAYASLADVDEEQYEDDVHEVVFFFGKEGTNIPNSETNDFKVEIKDLAVQSAVEKFSQMTDILEILRKELDSSIQSGDKEKMTETLEKMSVMKVFSDVLAKKNGK